MVYAFKGGEDGGYPMHGVVSDSSGNLYGTTNSFGAGNFGTIYKVPPGRTESVLYAFQGGSDGWGSSGLVVDSSGNLIWRNHVRREFRRFRLSIRVRYDFRSFNQMETRRYFIRFKEGMTVIGLCPRVVLFGTVRAIFTAQRLPAAGQVVAAVVAA